MLLIAVALAMDALAVAVGLSLRFRWRSFRQFFRLSFHFGLFQFLMPVLGWAAGLRLGAYIRDYDHWAAFGLLVLIGVKMIRDSSREEGYGGAADPTRGRWLVLLSLATSMDALAVGLSLSVMDVEIWLPSIVIGLVAASFTLLGMMFGGRLRRLGTGRLEILGGLILIGIGLKVLLEHTLFAGG